MSAQISMKRPSKDSLVISWNSFQTLLLFLNCILIFQSFKLLVFWCFGFQVDTTSSLDSSRFSSFCNDSYRVEYLSRIHTVCNRAIDVI